MDVDRRAPPALGSRRAVAIRLECAECGARSEGDAAGWRAYTAGGLEGEEDEDPMVVFFCAECSEREFA
jgi:hypothetical protein